MKFVSLFSGCGGMDEGLERAGHECVCQVEIDERALSILRKRWPNVPKIKDVKDANKRTLPAGFDLLAFGFPCTDLSLAGSRAGLAGDASGLWFEAHRIAMECRPTVILVENVPGLFSSRADSKRAQAGEDFAVVLSGLLGFPIAIPRGGWKAAGIAKGLIYHVAWRVFDSQFFGVAQQRHRVFFAASLTTSRINPAEILFEREGMPRNYSTRGEAREKVAASFEGSASLGGVRGGQLISTLSQKFNGAEQAFRLVVGSVTPPSGGADDNDASEDGTGRGTPLIAGGGGMDDKQIGVRKLTPLECEILQGFPENHTRYGIDAKGREIELSDSARYFVCGNAVTANVAEFIGIGIREAVGPEGPF